MRVSAVIALLMLSAGAPHALAQDDTHPISQPCAPEGAVRFICGQHKPELLLPLAGTHWVLVSWLAGGIAAVDSRSHRTQVLYPSASVSTDWDRTRFAQCPGPPDAALSAEFVTAGMALGRGPAGELYLYAVHYGHEHGIDVFAVHGGRAQPALTWVGCVMVPPQLGFVGIAALEDSALIAAHWLTPGDDNGEERRLMRAGGVNGALWAWRTGGDWLSVPGSESAGPNGVLASDDGRWLYFSASGARTLVRLSRGVEPAQRTEVPLGFRGEHISRDQNGSLIITGQDDEEGTHVVRVDPATLAVTPMAIIPASAHFNHGTDAIRLGNELWVGSSRTDRIAIVRLQTGS